METVFDDDDDKVFFSSLFSSLSNLFSDLLLGNFMCSSSFLFWLMAAMTLE